MNIFYIIFYYIQLYFIYFKRVHFLRVKSDFAWNEAYLIHLNIFHFMKKIHET